MRIFLTGATGFIGRRILVELLAAGHQVLGHTRSDAGAEALRAAGVEVHRGTLEDPDSMRRGAEKADAIIHTAFDHDFTKFAENCEKERQVLLAMGEVARDGKHPFLITSGVGLGASGPGTIATEEYFDKTAAHPRIVSENTGYLLQEAGADIRIIRLPQVHDTRRQGLVSPYIDLMRQRDFVGYLGAGTNRWSAAAVLDVAKLYVLALDRGAAGMRYHAVAEEAIPMRHIAEIIAKGLGLEAHPVSSEKAGSHFGWMASFMAMDMAASSALTQERLSWHPTGPTLAEDLRMMFHQPDAQK